MSFKKITESASPYRHLDKMSVAELLFNINQEDKKVPELVGGSIPQIEPLVSVIVDKMLMGGRLFYVGAGTSGRMGILDASECPPTFGVTAELVIGVIAGGRVAVTEAVEFAEDNTLQGWFDLQQHNINKKDVVIGLAASGITPYVIHALKKCRENNIVTGSISCNPGSPLSDVADFPVEVVTGPEFITGSTRMKAGTAQKLVLNMISTAVMIQLGRVEDNKMVNMQLTNEKLIERGVKIIMEKLNVADYGKAKEMLLTSGSVKKALEDHHS
ncbi:MAG: N-acetylmuramic acid 6-phosphate etherase [Ferruginibacter sp.]